MILAVYIAMAGPSAPLAFGQDAAGSGIHEAVRANDLQTVWSIARKNPARLLEMEDGDFGYTPLHAAAEHGHLQMVALLSVLGTDVNIRARNGETPLMTAAGECYTEVALCLIRNGADVKAAANDGTTALHFTATENLTDLLQVIIEKGADLNARTTDGETPLDLAIKYDSKESIALLVQAGASRGVRKTTDISPPQVVVPSAVEQSPSSLRTQAVQEYLRQLASGNDAGERLAPFSPSTPSTRWRGVTIEQLGTVDIPDTLEVQSREFIRFVKSLADPHELLGGLPEELLSELPDEIGARPDAQIGRTVIQPAGTNALNPKSGNLYFRMIIETERATVGDVATLNDRLELSESELQEALKVFESGMPPQYKDYLIESLPVVVAKVGSADAICIGYRRKGLHGPVRVETYFVQDYDRTHLVIVSYRESQASTWQQCVPMLLASFRFARREAASESQDLAGDIIAIPTQTTPSRSSRPATPIELERLRPILESAMQESQRQRDQADKQALWIVLLVFVIILVPLILIILLLGSAKSTLLDPQSEQPVAAVEPASDLAVSFPSPAPVSESSSPPSIPSTTFQSVGLKGVDGWINVKSAITNIGTYALALVIMLALVALPVLFIVGGVTVGEMILPWLMLLSILTLGFNTAILLPLALIPPTRPWAGLGFFISSYIFGLTGWFMGLLLTWVLWGGLAVVIGLLIAGIGVVPMGMLATLFKGMWAELGLLTLTVILTYGLRILGITLLGPEASDS